MPKAKSRRKTESAPDPHPSLDKNMQRLSKQFTNHDAHTRASLDKNMQRLSKQITNLDKNLVNQLKSLRADTKKIIKEIDLINTVKIDRQITGAQNKLGTQITVLQNDVSKLQRRMRELNLAFAKG